MAPGTPLINTASPPLSQFALDLPSVRIYRSTCETRFFA
jgi:hypothetical protein